MHEKFPAFYEGTCRLFALNQQRLTLLPHFNKHLFQTYPFHIPKVFFFLHCN